MLLIIFINDSYIKSTISLELWAYSIATIIPSHILLLFVYMLSKTLYTSALSTDVKGTDPYSSPFTYSLSDEL